MAKGNNFGLRTRDMAKAGQFATNAAARDGHMSYATAASLGQRWQAFAAYAREASVKRMEGVTAQLVAAYGQALASRAEVGDLAVSTAQNLVSAVNSVMSLATQGQWSAVSPTKDAGIGQRVNVRTEVPQGLERHDADRAAASLRDNGHAHGAVVVELARDLGLRAKECSLLDARRALLEAQDRGRVSITSGTKGGRPREVLITSPRQLETLRNAAAVQGNSRSMIPAGQSWAQWEGGGLREAREGLQAHGIDRIHELRAACAVERYQTLTGHLPRAFGGSPTKAADRAARLVIARELGHSRRAVTVAYLGSAR